MPELNEYQWGTVARAMANRMGREDTPDGWRQRLPGMVEHMRAVMRRDKAVEWTAEQAWEYVARILRHLGADV